MPKYGTFGQKYSNKTFLVANSSIFVSSKTLQLGKFEGADFKFDNLVFKFQPPKYINQTFLVPNLGIFVFSWNFANRQI